MSLYMHRNISSDLMLIYTQCVFLGKSSQSVSSNEWNYIERV